MELDAVDSVPGDAEDTTFKFIRPIPKLTIAMLVVGTREDVQPFIAFAKTLQASMLTKLYNTTSAFEGLFIVFVA